MPIKKMSVVTKKGDGGKSSTLALHGVLKSTPLFELLGTLDELQADIGVLKAHLSTPSLIEELGMIQSAIFSAGAEIAGSQFKENLPLNLLEARITEWEGALPPLSNFLIPGDNIPSSFAHRARASARRTERSLVANNLLELVPFFNRLSDYFFVMARFLSAKETGESIWRK